MARRRHSKLRIQERSLRTEKCEQKVGTKSVKLEMSINSGDVGVNSAGKSRMGSRARQGFVEDESRSKQKSKEVGRWNEGKSITETVETEMKDDQVRNLEPGTGESRVDKGRGRR